MCLCENVEAETAWTCSGNFARANELFKEEICSRSASKPLLATLSKKLVARSGLHWPSMLADLEAPGGAGCLASASIGPSFFGRHSLSGEACQVELNTAALGYVIAIAEVLPRHMMSLEDLPVDWTQLCDSGSSWLWTTGPY